MFDNIEKPAAVSNVKAQQDIHVIDALAEDDFTTLGSVNVCVLEFRQMDMAFMFRMQVATENRRKGIATYLARCAIQYCHNVLDEDCWTKPAGYWDKPASDRDLTKLYVGAGFKLESKWWNDPELRFLVARKR